jgi:manganese/zinc/iron transport system substrate-binding protein
MSRFSALKPLSLLGLIALCLLMLSGCAQDHGDKKVVVTTTGMITDLVRHVAGDTVEIQQLMGPGVDPHLFKAKESAIRKMFRADLVFYNGLHLEGKMVRLLDKNAKARAIARDIPESRLLEDEGQHDPHIWFDVALWIEALDRVEKDLIELCPEHTALYRQNARRYREELRGLDADVREAMQKIPKDQRVLVTSHDAFRYFGRAYDVEVVGLQGVSTANQAGLAKVQEVVDLLVDRRVGAIFIESSVPPDGARAVVERCAARGHRVVIPDGELFSDAMGEPGTDEGTYPGMIRHNYRLILQGLTGK